MPSPARSTIGFEMMPSGLAGGEAGRTRGTRGGSIGRTIGNAPIRFGGDALASATDVGDGPTEPALAMSAAEISRRCRAASSPARAFEIIVFIFRLQLPEQHRITFGSTILI